MPIPKNSIELALDKDVDSVEVFQADHDNLNANANLQVGDVDVSPSNKVPITDLESTKDSVEVLQDTHDDLNANANLQVGNADVSVFNRVPTALVSEKPEDSPHASASEGVFTLGVRNDVEGSLVDTDGDYAPFQFDDLGRLRVVAPDFVVEPVQEYESINNNDNKINYVVPANKKLFIQYTEVAISEGDKMVVELQDDGVGISSGGNGAAGTGGGSRNFPVANPLGPIAAGSTVRLSRIEGDSGKPWAGGFVGFLLDV